MAKFDIMPFASSLGGTPRLVSVRLDATAAYEVGDVVAIAAAGDLAEAADEPDVTTSLTGVAAVSAADVASRVGLSLADAATAGHQAQFWIFDLDAEFITDQITADDDTTLDEVPLESQIGDLANLRLGSGEWGLSVHASGANRAFAITRVLDANKEDVGKSGNAGVFAIFKRVT